MTGRLPPERDPRKLQTLVPTDTTPMMAMVPALSPALGANEMADGAQVEESANGGFEYSGPMRMAEPRHEIDHSGAKQASIRRKLPEHEIVFEADLNGDGLIGFNLSAIETNGDYSLATASGLYHIVDQSTGSLVTSFGNANGNGGWSITQVEESANGGFEIFWVNEDGRFVAHNIDDEGNKQSAIRRKCQNMKLCLRLT